MEDSVETESAPNPEDLVETRNRNRIFGRELFTGGQYDLHTFSIYQNKI